MLANKPLQFPVFIILVLTFACSAVWLGLTLSQYDGFEFDRPVDLKSRVDANVIEVGGWSLTNQRLRWGDSILGLVFSLFGVVAVYKSVAGLVVPAVAGLFCAGWIAFAALVLDSIDVRDARNHYCHIDRFECQGPQYIATVVFDGVCALLFLLAAVLLYVLSKAPTRSASGSTRRGGDAESGSNSKQAEVDDARATLLGMRPTLGVMVRNTDEDGVDVTEVIPGKSADAAGIERGDVILEIGRVATNDHDDFDRVMENAFPGETEVVVVVRDGARKQLHVTFGGVYNGQALSKKDINKLRKKAGKKWVATQETKMDAISPNM